jgi:PKD repeat protein
VQLKKIVLLLLTQAIYFVCAVALNAAENKLCSKSTEGTDFWFGFMEGRNYIDPHNTKIIVTARETTTFTIALGKAENLFNGTYSVDANGTTEIVIPWQVVEATGSEQVQDKGIHLVSQKPVSVYALNWDPYSADAAVIYPVETLGNEYFAICYYPNIDPRNPETGSGRNSEFLIVATEDQTSIKITPSKITDKLKPKDSTFVVVLNKGEVFQVQSENLQGTGKSGQGDLTGSHVIADKPVAFYSGALATTVPNANCCWDHLFEQIPPVHSWGRKYFTVPLKTRDHDIYRVLAAENNTTVSVSDEPFFYLNRGEFKEFELYQDNPKQIVSDKPVLVTQFSLSQNTDSIFTSGNGDPFMLVLNSAEQSISEINFVSFQSPAIAADTSYHGIKKHFLNVVAQTTDLPNIQLNGVSFQSEFNPFAGSDYSYAQIETKPGVHHLENVNGTNGFLAYVYGFGKWESYGYGSGFDVNLNLDLGENIEFFQHDTLLLCFGDTLKSDAGSQFDSYKWSTGEETQSILITGSGLIWVEAATNDGCKLRDSVFVFLSHPEVNIGDRYDTGCQPYSVKLNGGADFEKYIWQNEYNDTISVKSFFVADKTGEYRLTAYNKYRCAARDTFGLTIFPVPKVEIKGSNLICGTDTSGFSVTVSGTADSIWNFQGNYKWKANSPEIILTEESRNSVKVKANNWGDFELYYQIKTIDNCEVTDTFKMRFHPQPVNDFSIENDPVCNGYSKKLVFNGKATSEAVFEWDLNGRVFLDTLDLQNRIYLISEGIRQTVIPPVSLYINDKGCISDTVIKTFENSSPDLVMEADRTRGCDSLTVNFTAKMSTSDPVDYTWTINDSDLIKQQNFKSNFSGPGFYTVKLLVTNQVTQCRDGFSVDSMIKVFPTPIAHITADADVCYPGEALLVYTHQIDSSFCIWEAGGNVVSGFKNDSFLFNIYHPVEVVKLTVNEFGCKSKPFFMDLKRKPRFSFSVDSEVGCQPYLVEAVAHTGDPYIQFSWVTDSVPFPGNVHSFYYPDTGRYDIGLITYSSETQCVDTLVKKDFILVNKKPYAKFIPEHEIVLLDNSTLNFKNTSENAVNYYWDFGDSVSSQEISPTHSYTGVGKYHVQLISESDLSCADTFGVDIQVIPSVTYSPNAFRPDSEIPENKTFMPVGAGVDETRFSLKIYNRWGSLVFETESLYNPWNGTLKNGDDAPSGNYVWISEYFDIQGLKRVEKGQILLIR